MAKITTDVLDIPNLTTTAAALTSGTLPAARLGWDALPKLTVGTVAPNSPTTNDIWIDTN